MMWKAMARGASDDDHDAVPAAWQDGQGKVNCRIVKQGQEAFRHSLWRTEDVDRHTVKAASVALQSCSLDGQSSARAVRGAQPRRAGAAHMAVAALTLP